MNIMRSQINMAWTNVPPYHTNFIFFWVVESRIIFFSWHVMTKTHVMKKKMLCITNISKFFYITFLHDTSM